MKKNFINTPKAPKPLGSYTQAIRAGDVIYVSGQLPLSPELGTIPKKFKEQCHQVLRNVDVVLEGAGSSMELVVKVTIFLSDLAQFLMLNKIYEQYFGNSKTVRSCLGDNIPKDAALEIEAIALVCNQ